MIDFLARFATRHEGAIGVVGLASLAISSAAAAKFVTLPTIDLLDERGMLWVTAGYNVIWFGFLRPMVERRKKAFQSAEHARVSNG